MRPRASLRPARDRGFCLGGQLMIHERRRKLPLLPGWDSRPRWCRTPRQGPSAFVAEFVTDDVTRVDFSEHPFLRLHRARPSTLRGGHRRHRRERKAAGARVRRTLAGTVVSYCAVCDGGTRASSATAEALVVRTAWRRLGDGGAISCEVLEQGHSDPPAPGLSARPPS